jgi:hypothetical protein
MSNLANPAPEVLKLSERVTQLLRLVRLHASIARFGQPPGRL